MRKVALKGLATRKLRSALTALAIVLGVAMVSGTYVLTDTIDRGFNSVFTESYKSSDAVITPRTGFGAEQTGAGGLPARVLDDVLAADGVRSAAGSVVDQARLIDRDGEVLGASTMPSLAFGIDAGGDQALNPLELSDGAWPSGPGEVAIDEATAEAEGYAVGDAIEVAMRGPARDHRIAGLVRFGGASLGGGTIAVLDLATAQQVFGKDGRLDVVRVAGRPGLSADALADALAADLPRTAQVRTGEAQAASDSEDTSEGLGFLSYLLLAFGGVALFVGSFVIANTLSITIAQRTRELATLRTLGASRRQVLASVVVESLVLGVAASVVGLLAGIGLAKGLNALLVGVGIDLPSSGTVLQTRTIVVSLAVGILVTLLASVRPALRATRVPPIAAVRDGATLPPSRMERHSGIGSLVVLAVAIATLLAGALAGGLSTQTRLLASVGGAVGLFVGIALVAPRLVKPLASGIGWPASRLGGLAGRLARANSMRNPSRTASTAAALMIGLALVTFIGTMGNGLRSTFVGSVDELFVADYAITASAGTGLDPALDAAAGRIDGVTAVSSVRSGAARLDGEELAVSAVDRDAASVLGLRWHRGADVAAAGLDRDGVLVTREFAEEHRLDVGSAVSLDTPTGATLRLEVAGIWEEPKGGSPLGAVTISHEAFADGFPRPRNDFTFLNVDGGVSPATTAMLERELRAFPDAKVQTDDQFKDEQVGRLAQMLNLLYVLLGLSVIVSLIGIINTLVLTVYERTRELGMLRAIGMSRRGTRRMIRHESVITAVIGAALGIAAGVFLAALVSHALADQGFAFAIPVGTLIGLVLAAILVGVLAAILPARRAARLDVLRALQYE